MNNELRARLQALAESRDDPSKGRPISELIKTDEMLSGWESQRLRTYFTSICMEPRRDLDEYGRVLASGNLSLVQTDFMLRVEDNLAGPPDPDEANAIAHAAAAKELFDLRWGPTKTPIYNLLGLLSIMVPSRRADYLQIARFLIDTAKVPVDGVDLSGTTALSHCFSTKPGFDLEYAQMLYDAGGDVNHRNRYGNTVAQEIVQIWTVNDASAITKATKAFEWFLAHGGNVDIEDGDGWTVRALVEKLAAGALGALKLAMEKKDERRAARKDVCCTFCAREDTKLLQCGRCKKARMKRVYVAGVLKLSFERVGRLSRAMTMTSRTYFRFWCRKSEFPRREIICFYRRLRLDVTTISRTRLSGERRDKELADFPQCLRFSMKFSEPLFLQDSEPAITAPPRSITYHTSSSYQSSCIHRSARRLPRAVIANPGLWDSFFLSARQFFEVNGCRHTSIACDYTV
ncbi:putative MYND finger [Lyophyllum shimeji]|uniref:MYND finger n=1 Tax=Lyophyllum shimeji TaxID=47721 RepID=A0A9P3PZ81_LYOSH|nr:putative MYND finger [Lyophyllum shimeji]